jgi:hypothetical protein
MDAELLQKYLAYARTEEAQAVLFVKKHLAQAKGHWVDIVACQRYEKSPDPLHFRFVVGGLYKRRLTPQYPAKSDYTSDGRFRERDYHLATRAITWEMAHKDIEQQKMQRVAATKFEITGVSYDKNRNNKKCFRGRHATGDHGTCGRSQRSNRSVVGESRAISCWAGVRVRDQEGRHPEAACLTYKGLDCAAAGETTWAHGDAFYVERGGGRKAEPQASFSFVESAFTKSRLHATRMRVRGNRTAEAIASGTLQTGPNSGQAFLSGAFWGAQ